jgi:hypothetical protein
MVLIFEGYVPTVCPPSRFHDSFLEEGVCCAPQIIRGLSVFLVIFLFHSFFLFVATIFLKPFLEWIKVKFNY